MIWRGAEASCPSCFRVTLHSSSRGLFRPVFLNLWMVTPWEWRLGYLHLRCITVASVQLWSSNKNDFMVGRIAMAQETALEVAALGRLRTTALDSHSSSVASPKKPRRESRCQTNKMLVAESTSVLQSTSALTRGQRPQSLEAEYPTQES